MMEDWWAPVLRRITACLLDNHSSIWESSREIKGELKENNKAYWGMFRLKLF